MNRSICSALLVSLLATVSNAQGNSLQLPRTGIDTLLDSLASESGAQVQKVPLPDISSSVSGVTLDIKNMRFGTFERPKVTYQAQNTTTLLAKVSLPKIVVTGAANAERKTFVTTQKDSGEFDLTFTNAMLELPVAVRKFENGTLTIHVGECKPNLGTGNLSVRNFREKFSTDAMALSAKNIRTYLLSKMCPTVEKMLKEPANRSLATYPIVFDVGTQPPSNGQNTLALTQDQLQVTLPPAGP